MPGRLFVGSAILAGRVTAGASGARSRRPEDVPALPRAHGDGIAGKPDDLDAVDEAAAFAAEDGSGVASGGSTVTLGAARLMFATIKVHGAKEIEAVLKELGAQAAGRILRSALTRAGTPIVKRARELAPQPGAPDDPYASGRLRKAIGKRLPRQRGTTQALIVGIERPRWRIAHLLEFGAAHMAAEPYLPPSLDEKAQKAIQVMQQAMRNGIEREARKLAAKDKEVTGWRLSDRWC
jgi:HK97 gp10 family phage protein